MKVAFLGYDRTNTCLVEYIEELGHDVEEIQGEVSDLSWVDIVISFGYRHILKPDVLRTSQRPILNLHISYLPFNRGAHPNFWSWMEGTQSGVSIHEVDRGVDTGPIVTQELAAKLNSEMTFRETHLQLTRQIENLFKRQFDEIFEGTYKAVPQDGQGTHHRTGDLPKWFTNWDMRIADAIEEYNRHV
ncbi:MAG: formyltransferase family protein [Filomicrobium sp.]